MQTATKTKTGQDFKTALAQLHDFVATDMQKVNEVILSHLQSDVALIPQLAEHVIKAGGKRLRPLLTLASAKLCGYEGDRHIKLAACVEFIHTATLLHDDVVDESNQRRGQDTANQIWGNTASVLVGDFLFSRAFELMVADGDLEVLKLLSQSSSRIAEGEVHQLMTMSNIATDEQTYIKVINAKTAQLFSAACEIGAIITNQPETHRQALADFGKNLGINFQMIDDALDYTATDRGKNIGDDFKEGKMTLPVIHAISKANNDQKQFWHRTIENLDQKKGDLETAIHHITQHQSLSFTLDRAQSYATQAAENLNPFPNTPTKSLLTNLITTSTHRGY